MNSDVKRLLEAVRDGSVEVDEALHVLKAAPFADLGYAKVDLHRKVRQGAAEVIYGAGKTVAQMEGILDAMAENGQGPNGVRAANSFISRRNASDLAALSAPSTKYSMETAAVSIFCAKVSASDAPNVRPFIKE